MWSAWLFAAAHAAQWCSLSPGTPYDSIQEALERGCTDITLAPGAYEGFGLQGTGFRQVVIHGAGVTSVIEGRIALDHQGGGAWTVDLERLSLDPRDDETLRAQGELPETLALSLDRVEVVCSDNKECITIDTASFRAVETSISTRGSPKTLVTANHGHVQLEAGTSLRGGTQNGWLLQTTSSITSVLGTQDRPVTFGASGRGGVLTTGGESTTIAWTRFQDLAGGALSVSDVAQVGVTDTQFCGPSPRVVQVEGGCGEGCVLDRVGVGASAFASPGIALSSDAPLLVHQSTFRDLDLVVAGQNSAIDLQQIVVFGTTSLGGQGALSVSESLVDAAVQVPPGLDLGDQEVHLRELVSATRDSFRQCAEFRYHPEMPENPDWLTAPRVAGLYALAVTDGPDGDGVPYRFDCDDDDPTIHALQPEFRVDGFDDDCDGFIDCYDTQDMPPWTEDADRDGWISYPPPDVCGSGSQWDCDDTDPTINDLVPFYEDVDDDGFGTGTPVYLCPDNSEGLVAVDGDCDDARGDVNPEGVDLPNDGIDQDCSGTELVGVVEGGGCSCEVGGSEGGGLLALGSLVLAYRRRRSGGSSGRSLPGRAQRS
ncbi:MAG: putative metal-binding motif-containing protein [Alphaproteobacteria bacterium]|nr:putative metal-binding motif-containing protein [Alphaproteobacteria bacterium]